METIVNFLHEWAIPGLLLCILILVIIGIRQHRVNNAVSANEEDNESSGEGELPLAEESPADEETGNAEAEQVAAAAENAEVRQEPAECLLPPRRFGRYTAVSPTDVVLTAFRICCREMPTVWKNFARSSKRWAANRLKK